MTAEHTMAPTRIWNSLPEPIQTAILTYATEAKLTPPSVIEGAISQFLALDTTLSEDESIYSEDTSLLSELPPLLRNQAKEYAISTEMPPEFVLELAIAHFLDPDSVTFDDCRVKVQQGSIEWLKLYADKLSVTAA